MKKILTVLCTLLLAAVILTACAGGGKDKHEKDLLLYLKFDEGKGLTVTDAAGKVPDTDMNYAYHGAAYMDDRDPEWRTDGISGGCLLLDGSSTYVQYNRNDIQVSGKALTVQAWIAPRTFEWDDPNAADNGTDSPTGIISQANKANKRKNLRIFMPSAGVFALLYHGGATISSRE